MPAAMIPGRLRCRSPARRKRRPNRPSRRRKDRGARPRTPTTAPPRKTPSRRHAIRRRPLRRGRGDRTAVSRNRVTFHSSTCTQRESRRGITSASAFQTAAALCRSESWLRGRDAPAWQPAARIGAAAAPAGSAPRPRGESHDEAISHRRRRGQRRRRQDHGVAHAARLLHRPSCADPRVRQRGAEGHAQAFPSRRHRNRRRHSGAGPDEDFRHAVERRVEGDGDDVRAGLLSPTLRALRDIGFLDAVKKGQITFAVFHILGSSIASLNEIEETAPFTADARYFLVKNYVNNTSFFEWDQATHSAYFKKLKDAVEITIPKLNEMAYEQVELASVPFLTFVANKGANGEAANYSFVLRGYVRHWLGNVWAEYDRIKLNDIIGAAAAANGARAQAARS